jgi:hypothetical protein
MVGWLMSDDLERIWKEAAMAYSKYYPGICLDGLRKTTENLSQVTSVPA